ncbi:zinc ribbon domain-containing protein [Fredinandcohnia humi]
MAFCSNCGTKLEELASFCTECGASIESTAALETYEEQEISAEKPVGEELGASVEVAAALDAHVEQLIPSEPVQSTHPVGQRSQTPAVPFTKVKVTKKQAIIASIVAAVVILLFAGYKIGDVATDKERVIETFETALDQKDEKALVDLLSSDDKELKITEKSIASFIDYLDKNPREEKKILEGLRDQSEAYDNNDTDADESEELVTLKRDGKKFLFYDHYVLHLTPVYVTLGTNYKDTVFYLNGEKIGTSTEQEFEELYGPFVPGRYKIEAKLKTDFVELVKVERLDIVDVEEDTYMYMLLEGEDVEVSLGMDTSELDIATTLYINGEDTGIDILTDPIFGPVLTDGSMEMNLEIAYPWGKVTTNEIAIDSNYMEIKPTPFTDEQFADIMELVKQYFNEELQYFSTGDASKLTTVTEAYLSALEGTMSSIVSEGYYFNGKYLGSQFSTENMYVEYYDDSWHVQLPVINTVNGTSELDGEHEEFVIGYDLYLQYDEANKKWAVNDLVFTEVTSFDGEENVKEIKNENAKTVEYGRVTAESIKKENDEYMVYQVMDGYLYGRADAIYYNDFSLVAPYVKEGSHLYSNTEYLVEDLSSRGIYENVDDYEIVGWTSSGNTYTIHTREVVTTYDSDGSSDTMEFEWTYIAEYDEEYGELLLTEMK